MILLVGGEKGGTGKTTLAVNLAAYHQGQGRDVVIVDTDTQGSALDWSYYRQDSGLPPIPCLQLTGRKLIKEIEASRRDVIIDAGGRDSPELRAGMVLCDVLLVPLRASQYDIASMEKIVDLLHQAATSNPGIRCIVVINGLKSNPRIPEFTEAVQALKEYKDVQVLPFPIIDRMSYARSGAEGKGVHEMADPKATAEIRNLYEAIYGKV